MGAQKTHYYDSSPNYLLRSVEAALSDLNTGYLDVLLVHRPDYLMNTEELAAAFTDLNSQGVADQVGVDSLDPVIYAWALSLPCNAIPIIGSSKIDRVKRALSAADIRLEREQ